MSDRRHSQLGTALPLLAFAVLALDQATKYAVERFTATGSSRVLIPGILESGAHDQSRRGFRPARGFAHSAGSRRC